MALCSVDGIILLLNVPFSNAQKCATLPLRLLEPRVGTIMLALPKQLVPVQHAKFVIIWCW
jgi:hypothetical protein